MNKPLNDRLAEIAVILEAKLINFELGRHMKDKELDMIINELLVCLTTNPDKDTVTKINKLQRTIGKIQRKAEKEFKKGNV